MGKVRQKLNALRAHWFQILVACGALALAFGLGMSFQADFVEQAAREDRSGVPCTASPTDGHLLQ